MVFMAFFSLLGLPFGMTTLILAHTAFCIPYVYMLVKARLVGMDKVSLRLRWIWALPAAGVLRYHAAPAAARYCFRNASGICHEH